MSRNGKTCWICKSVLTLFGAAALLIGLLVPDFDFKSWPPKRKANAGETAPVPPNSESKSKSANNIVDLSKWKAERAQVEHAEKRAEAAERDAATARAEVDEANQSLVRGRLQRIQAEDELAAAERETIIAWGTAGTFGLVLVVLAGRVLWRRTRRRSPVIALNSRPPEEGDSTDRAAPIVTHQAPERRKRKMSA